MSKAAFNRKKTLFTSEWDSNLRKKLVKCYTWRIALYGLWKIYQKYLENFEKWCWRKISWTDHVRNEEVLHTVTEVRNILHTTKRRKDDWIGHILHRNCLLKHNIEGKIGRLEVTGKQDDISSYWLNLRK